jgi:deferrochelatase/peroxidase EfeB
MVSDAVLQRPLAWRDPSLIPMLAQLQGNILKGHGRSHTRNLFLRFGSQPAGARRALADLAHSITSAIEQLSASVRYRADGTSGGPVRFLFLSAAGYRTLGVEDAAIPADTAFREGMHARTARLGDPAPDGWDAAFRAPPHALLLIGADNITQADNEADRIVRALGQSGIEVVAIESGAPLHKCGPDGPNSDHLGQHGGVSQPLMLADDVAGAGTASGGTFGCDPAFGPGQLALVRDPGSANEEAFGSYLVFRKLEKDVAASDRVERGLALTLEAALPAGADAQAFAPAGIAVANDRWGVGADTNADPAIEPSRLMPRRTIAYGPCAGAPDDRGAGLLFMAYNQDIARQFEFVQANAASGCSESAPHGGTMRMRGGDYFFAPSIGFLA